MQGSLKFFNRYNVLSAKFKLNSFHSVCIYHKSKKVSFTSHVYFIFSNRKMFLILRICYDTLKKFDDNYRDRRTDTLFLAGSLPQMLFLLISYYLFVKNIGPKLMKDRKAFELKNAILIYNAVQVLLNGVFFVRCLYIMFWAYSHVSVYCALPIRNTTTVGLEELYSSYFYFLLKILDYADTIFMVLRKRTRQITFLHVYHHMIMSLGTFVFFRYLPGGHAATVGVVNTFVHSVMYSYYFLSALRPELKNSIWWKKHITQIQICQFLYSTVWLTLPLIIKNCDYPVIPAAFVFIQAIFMLSMFSNFYWKTYILKKSNQN